PDHLRAVLPGPYQGPVLLGVRPNRFVLLEDASGLAGTVTLVEHVDAESLIAVTLRDARTAHEEEEATPNEVMVTLSGYSPLKTRQQVSVRIDLSDAVLFSAATGQNLAHHANPESLS
ncbi:MAG: hypothetical protein ABWY07_09545, partial [Burkholderiales bacterium]